MSPFSFPRCFIGTDFCVGFSHELFYNHLGKEVKVENRDQILCLRSLFINSSQQKLLLYVCGLVVPSVWDRQPLSSTTFGFNFIFLNTALGHEFDVIP